MIKNKCGIGIWKFLKRWNFANTGVIDLCNFHAGPAKLLSVIRSGHVGTILMYNATVCQTVFASSSKDKKIEMSKCGIAKTYAPPWSIGANVTVFGEDACFKSTFGTAYVAGEF